MCVDAAGLAARSHAAASGNGQTASDRATADSSEVQRNRNVVRRFFDAINSGDGRAAAALWADNAQNYGQSVPGNAQIFFQNGGEDIRGTFPDWHMEIIDLIAEGESVVALCRVSGTHHGIGRLPLNGGLLVGVEPTGKRFEVAHIHWFKVRGGKIVDHYVARDDVGMYKQLGVLPTGVVSDTSTRLASGGAPIVGTPETSEPAELDRNRKFMRSFFENQNNRSSQTVGPTSSSAAPSRTPTPDRDYQAAFEDILRTFPDWHWTIVDMVAQGDSVVCLCRVAGTHRGVARFPLNGGLMVGVEPTGKHFEVWHIHWFRVRDGRMAADYRIRDDIGMYKQLGLLPQ
jgi:predicted ester cyclase